MNRFFLSPERCQGSVLSLEGGEARHALRVLRLRPGDRVRVLDGAGQDLLAVVRDCARESLSLEVVERTQAPAPSFEVCLLQALPKGRLIEEILQKSTELGVHRVVPLITERVVVHLDSDNAAAKAAKWRQAAIEAVKQCGAPWLPRVEAPVTMVEYLARGERFDLSMIGALQGQPRDPRDYFDDFRRLNGRPPRSLALWIGPEGDFTPSETAAALAAGALPITLGPQVLRVDTAALCALSLTNYEARRAVAAGS